MGEVDTTGFELLFVTEFGRHYECNRCPGSTIAEAGLEGHRVWHGRRDRRAARSAERETEVSGRG